MIKQFMKFYNNEWILDKTLNQINKISHIIELKNNRMISTPYGNSSIIFFNIISKLLNDI